MPTSPQSALPQAVPDLTRLLVIDDHPLFRDALISSVRQAYADVEAVEASSLDDAFAILDRDRNFDIALLDLNLPGVHGFEGLLKLRTGHPRLPILVVSGLEDPAIINETLSFGAAGFVPKSLGREVLALAVTTILDGGVYTPTNFEAEAVGSGDDERQALIERLSSLTPQQLRVLMMLREGLLNKQIAHELDVGDTTVKKHVSEILRKLKVYSRTQAVIEVSRLDQDELFDMQKRFFGES